MGSAQNTPGYNLQDDKEKLASTEKILKDTVAHLKSTEEELAATKRENDLLKYVSYKAFVCVAISVVTAISFWVLTDRVLNCQLNKFQAVVITITVVSWCVFIAFALTVMTNKSGE